MKILYEDNHLIAVFKPAGILSQPDKTGDVSMYDIVKDYIRTKKGKGKTPLLGNVLSLMSQHSVGANTGVFLGLLHRLDRTVSGVMLFAKTSKGASRLSEQFRNHEVEKEYHAIVIGKLPQNRGVLTNRLIKDEKLKKGKERSTGKEAKLYYEVINPVRNHARAGAPEGPVGWAVSNGVKTNNRYSLLKINIEGGQFHQIRAQLSLAGFPILGDVKYGGKNSQWNDERSIALSATGLSFKSATRDKRVNLTIKIPREWLKYISDTNY